MPQAARVELAHGLGLLAAAALVSLAVGLVAVHATRLRRLVPRDAPDPLGVRKLQRRPMPLAGGLCLGAVVLGCAPYIVWSPALRGFGPAFLAGMALALGIGFVDDRRKDHGLPWPVKLAGQVAAAGAFLLAREPAVPAAFGVFWLVLSMNAWNFLDNTDGVAAQTGIGAALTLLLAGPDSARNIVWCGLLAGTLLGFLPLNWPRPSAYLGDAGAHGLGFAFGWLSLDLVASHGAAGLLAVHVVPLADMAQVVAVRARLAIPPWRGDRRHLAHRLQARLPAAAIAPIFLVAEAALTAVLVLGGRP